MAPHLHLDAVVSHTCGDGRSHSQVFDPLAEEVSIMFGLASNESRRMGPFGWNQPRHADRDYCVAGPAAELLSGNV